MNFDRRQAGPYTYGFMWVERKPTAVLDFWHQDPCQQCATDRCWPAHRAIELFKANDDRVVGGLSSAMAVIAQHEFAQMGINAVVPTIASGAVSAPATSSTGRLATAVAHAMGVTAEFGMFSQTPRESLHRGAFKNRAQRRQILDENIQCAAGQYGRRVLLVDDVISSGATLTAYSEKVTAQDGTLVAVAGIVKYASEEAPLNESFLRELVHGR